MHLFNNKARYYTQAFVTEAGKAVGDAAVVSARASKKVATRTVKFPVNVTKASKDLASEVRVARQTKAAWKQHEAK